ncbi:hypothetical protein [Streptomyces brasiliensis]|uniref:Uncharacterized protein n=1 Tax=Streptomyces brasiliensis TaxID=1954 RepID=A0A917KR20_9ACTN|nr:hypothetical protein [Streptomyces brasiliensis]GGJ25946.1 hypothetical protein GCM10010121_041330 [Streptomyces brasiliensis]
MGIRMLHHRTAPARTTAAADAATAAPLSSSPLVPALAADASTARIPTGPATTVRTTVAGLGRRLTGHVTRPGLARAYRHWSELGRSYLALLLTLVPRSRPQRTITVFAVTLTERPDGSARPRPGRDEQKPEPGATP